MAPMKLSTLACFGFLLFGLLPGAEAQTLPGAMADVVLQLKLTGMDPATVSRDINGLVLKDERNKPIPAFEAFWEVRDDGVLVAENWEWASRLRNEKYGNKEFLEDLVELGVIESITGWSLKFVQPTYGVPEDLPGLMAGDGWYFLVHRNSELNPPIPLHRIIFFDKDTTQAKANERTTQRFDEAGEPTTSSRTLQESTRHEMSFIIDFNHELPEEVEYYFDTHGIYAGGMRLQFLGPDKRPVFMPSAGKLSSLSGRMVYEDFGSDTFRRRLVEGGVTHSAGKFSVDVGIYADLVER
jgi:hypothetical protein